jgi:hypothetical protein
MVEKFRNYIEWGSWEEDLERQFDYIERFCWVIFLLAAVYFGPTLLRILMREVGR